MNEQGVAEGLPQTLRKVVPGYAKREIDKKMDAGKFGKTDADKDANFQRYKKIQDKLKEQGVAEGVEQYLEEMRRAGYDIVTEAATLCPECGGPAYNNQMLAEKQDACYHKVKSRYKVWPSAYASGALVRCRKKGAKNWGNKSKK
jgi:predicted GNAT family acetyltransferase